MSVTQEQMDIIISFMEDHSEMAQKRSNSSLGRQKLNELWEELKNKLNAVGHPNKSAKGWRKVWTDYKYRTKRKLSTHLSIRNTTGSGPTEELPLTRNEAAVVEIIKKSSPTDTDDVSKLLKEQIGLQKKTLKMGAQFQKSMLDLMKERNKQQKEYNDEMLRIIQEANNIINTKK